MQGVIPPNFTTQGLASSELSRNKHPIKLVSAWGALHQNRAAYSAALPSEVHLYALAGGIVAAHRAARAINFGGRAAAIGFDQRRHLWSVAKRIQCIKR